MGVLGTNFTRRSTAPRRHETLELQPIPGTETATWGGCDLGNSGVWDRDYGWGVRVRRHLAHAGGVLYGMELGSVTLKINSQHTHKNTLNCALNRPTPSTNTFHSTIIKTNTSHPHTPLASVISLTRSHSLLLCASYMASTPHPLHINSPPPPPRLRHPRLHLQQHPSLPSSPLLLPAETQKKI